MQIGFKSLRGPLSSPRGKKNIEAFTALICLKSAGLLVGSLTPLFCHGNDHENGLGMAIFLETSLTMDV